MKSPRARLAPQMLHYTEQLYEDGSVRWLPYIMYFQPTNHRSKYVNTDQAGFRISHGQSDSASPAGRMPTGPVRLLVGNSAAFGVGATHDRHTLPSLLWTEFATTGPWLNVAGRSHNSAQELLLFTLYQHLFPEIDEIVIFSGFNNLSLARFPAPVRGDHGAFYLCYDYLAKIDELREKPRKSVPDGPELSVPEQIGVGADLTLRHLDGWRLLARGLGARLSYVLQPLAPWVRDRPAAQEKLLFDELDARFRFSDMFGDIISPEVGREYAAKLRSGCEKLGVPFLNINELLADEAATDDWLFVDRAHLTDYGYRMVARLVAEHLKLA